MPDSSAAPSLRTRVRRMAELADYDATTLYAIIDAAYLCHIAFHDAGGAHCIPTACWRDGGHLYIHGSNGSRLLKRLTEADSCVAITHLDGLVLARSAFNHAMNYRSAMIYGRFEKVAGAAAKQAALAALMDKLAPGRQAEVRAGSAKEMAATSVLRIALDEAAAKVRSGAPRDDADDMALPVWAGVLPFAQRRTAPLADAGAGALAPGYVRDWCQE
ncbi:MULTISPECIES: pyridoxamine 5'-phosphate oxidase family protein [unclassified Janthinobacterium]|uniref:pyridoxamine 5'-phosphate oxidase family protein n=1 Tax=unclassified Janthinobacterium TaxID=2610881 RepID=UPI000348FA76|nr:MULTISPECIES: pyridoxamine 5'-phosphate oxidase family protein [unclassified Janthinobacterium]MEC5159038.1 nitroimidazol reductase NimA-like FMN-containing flavoprotein (pyridoxamine 5'-phosphate oxidase superfamily) [Janthinobacterium sp. CG_S6]